MSELIVAASNGSVTKVRKLLESEIDINIKDNQGKTSLHHACSKGHLVMVKILIGHGANVNLQTNSKKTPLHLASKKGNINIVKFLISKGASVNAKTKFETQPIHIAAENGYFEIAKILVEHGAELNTKIVGDKKLATDSNKTANIGESLTPILLAVKNRHLRIVEILVKNGADPNHKIGPITPLTQAVANLDLNMIKVLVENGANINLELYGKPEYKSWQYGGGGWYDPNNGEDEVYVFGGGTVLHAAIKTGNWNIIKYLVEQGANVNIIDKETKETPLMSAISWYLMMKQKKPEMARLDLLEDIVKIFAENGLDVTNELEENCGGRYSLKRLMGLKLHYSVEILLGKGANPNALQIIDPNKTWYEDAPPLFHAIYHRMGPKIIQTLIKMGAKINHINATRFNLLTKGSSPLHLASQTRQLGILRLLLKNGAKINAKDALYATPLHKALENVNTWYANSFKTKPIKNIGPMTKVAIELIKNGAELDCLDEKGKTPLHLASENNCLEVAKLLLEKGAKIDVETKEIETPLSLAICKKLKEMVKLLIENGADVNRSHGEEGTILHVAIKHLVSDEILDLLLEKGVDLKAKNKHNQTALDYAKSVYGQDFGQRNIYIREIIRKIIKYTENSKNEQNEGEPEQKKFKFEDCVICYEPRYEMFVLNPCGHAKTCEVCCMKIIHLPEVNTNCPVCRQDVDSYTKVFF